MKKLTWALLGAAAAIIQASAQDVVWVQNANFSLTAQVQISDGVAKRFALNSRTLIQFLTGATNVGTETISQALTNGTITVTNDIRLPSGTNITADFVLTNNYVVTADGVSYTNNINFTNPIPFTSVEADTPTYTFPNTLTLTSVNGVDTNIDTVLFPEDGLTNATDIIAIQSTNSDTNVTVFTVIGTSTTNIDTVVTNIVPALFQSRTQRLIAKSAPDTETFQFFIRDGNRKMFVDYDVTTFFHYAQLSKVTQAKGTGFTDFLDLSIDLVGDVGGTSFQTEANGRQTRAVVNGAEGLVVRSLSATCVGSGVAASPLVPPTKPLPAGPMVLSGRFTLNGGKLEPSTTP